MPTTVLVSLAYLHCYWFGPQCQLLQLGGEVPTALLTTLLKTIVIPVSGLSQSQRPLCCNAAYSSLELQARSALD